MSDIKQYEPLWGAWYVDSLIGEGSFGKVYKVRREEFGKTYYSAVKIISIPQNEADLRQIRGEGMDDASARSYFHAFVADIIQEIDLMSEFRGNSNIVSFEDHKVIEQSGQIGWDILIRMELLTSLTDHVIEKPLARDEIIKLGIHICRALELCAIKKTIHRDIKPDNIFVSQYGEYKLGDFGIARQIERTTSGLSKKGTYTYMAPEVFTGQEYGSSVDVYSLGIVMYRFLNQNRTPFLPAFPTVIKPSDRDEALQRRIKGETLPPLKGVSSDLNAIILKACAYDRKERFSSPTEMREALEAVAGGKSYAPVSIPIQGTMERERTNDTAGVLDDSTAGARLFEDRTSATEGAFTTTPQSSPYSPYHEATSKTEGVFTTAPKQEAIDKKVGKKVFVNKKKKNIIIAALSVALLAIAVLGIALVQNTKSSRGEVIANNASEMLAQLGSIGEEFEKLMAERYAQIEEIAKFMEENGPDDSLVDDYIEIDPVFGDGEIIYPPDIPVDWVENPGNAPETPIVGIDPPKEPDGEYILSISMPVKDENGNVICVIVLYAPLSKLFEAVATASGEYYYLFVTDDSGKILYHPSTQMVGMTLSAENNGLGEDFPDNIGLNDDGLSIYENSTENTTSCYSYKQIPNCDMWLFGVYKTQGDMFGDKLLPIPTMPPEQITGGNDDGSNTESSNTTTPTIPEVPNEPVQTATPEPELPASDTLEVLSFSSSKGITEGNEVAIVYTVELNYTLASIGAASIALCLTPPNDELYTYKIGAYDYVCYSIVPIEAGSGSITLPTEYLESWGEPVKARAIIAIDGDGNGDMKELIGVDIDIATDATKKLPDTDEGQTADNSLEYQYQELSLTPEQKAMSDTIATALHNLDCESVFNGIAGNLEAIKAMCIPSDEMPYPFAYKSQIDEYTIYFYQVSPSASNGDEYWHITFAEYDSSSGVAYVAHCDERKGVIDTVNGNQVAVLSRITYKDGVSNGEYAWKQGNNLRWEFGTKREGNAANGKREGMWMETLYNQYTDKIHTVMIEYKDGKVINGILGENGVIDLPDQEGTLYLHPSSEWVEYASESIIDCYLTGDSPWVNR